MTLDPIAVQKTLDERLTEYTCIFSEKTAEHISILEVKKVWSSFVEIAIGGLSGWQALWKIPRATCESLQIDYPTAVFVEVEELSNSVLTALVTIVAVEDDIQLPEQHEAMLINLYPTVQQQDATLCIRDIAQCLDTVRFFYKHIWQPWDEEDKNEDWVSNCLEPRMKLFRDMQAGLIGLRTTSYIRRLLQKARNLHKRKSFLEMKLHAPLKNHVLVEDLDNTVVKNVALELLEVQQQWDRVRHDIGMIENPLLREKMIGYRQKRQKTLDSSDVQYLMVWHGGDCEELLYLMNKALTVVPQNARIKPCDFETALEQVDENDTIFLCRGTYKVNEEAILMRNGTIKGFPSAFDVILSPEYFSPTLIDWTGVNLRLDNLSLSGQATQALVVVRSGVLSASNCHFICDPLNASTTGVCFMPGSAAEFTDCQLSGFDAGIAAHSESALHLVGCRITSCAIGIQIYDGAEVSLKDCTIQNCLEYGLVFRTSDGNIEDIVGSLELLDRWETIAVENMKLEGNVRGNVLVSLLPSCSSLLDVNMESEDSFIAPSNSVLCKSNHEFEDASNSSSIMD